MKEYGNTGVYLSPSSTTAQLLAAGKTAEAAKDFKATTAAFEKTYPNKADRDWFMAASKGRIPFHDKFVTERVITDLRIDSVSLVLGADGEPTFGIRGTGVLNG